MALYRCGGGGGMLEETVLWTNPDVTVEFASQSVTLSDSVDNYDFIKFVFNLSTTATTHRGSIYSVEELKTFTNPTNNWSRASSPMRTNSNNASFVRGIIYQSGNSLAIGNASGYQSSSTTNSALIPYQIIGMKYGNRRPTPPGTYDALFGVLPANYWHMIGQTALNQFPMTNQAGYSHNFVANVTGYTTLQCSYSGNNYISIWGIKPDGTGAPLADGSYIAQTSAIFDVSAYKYVIYSDVKSSNFNLSVTLT